jgi:hypothetical protein
MRAETISEFPLASFRAGLLWRVDGRGAMNKRFLLALFVSPILVAGTAALADDAKTFPGNMCQPKVDGESALERDDETGVIRNVGGSTGVLFCPIVRDTMARDSFEGAIIIVEETVTSRVECSIRSVEPTGEIVASIPSDDPMRARRIPRIGFLEAPMALAGVAMYQFAEGSPNIRPSVREGHYFFRCLLPPDPEAGIISYRTVEND